MSELREQIADAINDDVYESWGHSHVAPELVDRIIAIVREALTSPEAVEAAGIGWVGVFADSPPMELEPGEGVAAEEAVRYALDTAFGADPRQEEER